MTERKAQASRPADGLVGMTLTERRAEFVYEGARIAAKAAGAPIIPAPWGEREQEFRDQFLKVIERQCGEQRSRSPEELHGSWMQAYFAMGWVYGAKYSRENKTHPDLVPYADLGQLERDKDAVFVELCEIARQWIYDAPKETCSPSTFKPTRTTNETDESSLDPQVRFWIAYRYTAIERVESLSIGMISADEKKIRAFAQEKGWEVTYAEDGEMFPM